jgi:hypothetical protein
MEIRSLSGDDKILVVRIEVLNEKDRTRGEGGGEITNMSIG